MTYTDFNVPMYYSFIHSQCQYLKQKNSETTWKMSMYRYSWLFISWPAPGGSVYDALLVHGLELDHLLVLLAQRLHTHARSDPVSRFTYIDRSMFQKSQFRKYCNQGFKPVPKV